MKCEVWKGEVWSGQNSIVFCNCRIVLANCMGFQVVLVDALPMEFSRKFRRKRVFFSLHFGASDFPSKNPFKKCVKKFFFALASRSVLNLQFPMPLRVVLLCFCNSVSADRIVVAASLLLPACLLQLDLENRFGVAA